MTTYSPSLSQYVTGLFAGQDEALRTIYSETPKKGLPPISVKPEEGKFLQILVYALGTQKALEIGTLGGYSGTWIARGLAPGGRLITLEKNPVHAEVARSHFELSGVSDRVEIRVGDAHDSLRQLSSSAPFDFVFIDAEKGGYPQYFEWAAGHIRPGGVIAAHNAFRNGSVAGLGEKDEWTEIMQAFNRDVAAREDFLSTIYPAGDGTLIAVKKR